MKTHLHGTAVTQTIAFVDLNGDPVAPTAASVRVLDQEGAELVTSTPIVFSVGDTEVDVIIPAEINTLAPVGPTQALRLVELTMETAAGPVVTLTRYIIRTLQRLAVLLNSFQTFDSALLEAMDMPRMDGWTVADEAAKTAALIEAYMRLTQIGYRVPKAFVDAQSVIDPQYAETVPPRRWHVMTYPEFAALPEPFRRALRRAQIAEADVVLNGDVIGGRRRAGLMSETIGESSMMFRPGKPLNLGVSEQALAYLSGYVDLRVGLTRA